MAKATSTTINFKPMDPVRVRHQKRLTQLRFWKPIGVTQSGGSRYEASGRHEAHGRNIPRPVQMLLVIAHGTEAQAQALFKQLRGEK